jgi:glycosyltransferase involved in cell wall biosynthesis
MSAQAGHNTTRPDRTAPGRMEGGTRTGGSLSQGPFAGKPLISVVTVVRNGRDVIEQTIQSVLDQRYPNLEYIVIDGGSTDGTVDIIRKYADRITFWSSETDNGIYDAMNKALDHVRGRGHLFLNAGDHFVGDVLSDELMIPSHLPVSKMDIFNKIRPVRPKDHRQGLPYCHQGIIFETKGIRFSTKYRFAADYLYFLDHGYTRLLSSAVSGHVYYDNAGLSKINSTIRDREIAGIIRARFGLFWYSLFVAKCAVKDLIRAVIRRWRKA